MSLANMKVEPNKTIIFLKSVNIAGWIWQQGGFLSLSPHRKSSLINTKEEYITKVKHMRSFIGLYKTLHINKIPITVKYLRGKYMLNEISDHQSHYLLECNVETCTIHKL